MFVPVPSASNDTSSRMIRSMWARPFFGGTNVSILSVKSISPTLSLFLIAEKARTAHISAAISFLVCVTEPKFPDRLKSTTSMTVSSLSSSNTFTKGRLKRADTFQSIVRMSSPNWYSRTSENSMPRPLKTLWYSPEKTWLTTPRVLISIRRTFLRSSRVSMALVSFRA